MKNLLFALVVIGCGFYTCAAAQMPSTPSESTPLFALPSWITDELARRQGYERLVAIGELAYVVRNDTEYLGFVASFEIKGGFERTYIGSYVVSRRDESVAYYDLVARQGLMAAFDVPQSEFVKLLTPIKSVP